MVLLLLLRLGTPAQTLEMESYIQRQRKHAQATGLSTIDLSAFINADERFPGFVFKIKFSESTKRTGLANYTI